MKIHWQCAKLTVTLVWTRETAERREKRVCGNSVLLATTARTWSKLWNLTKVCVFENKGMAECTACQNPSCQLMSCTRCVRGSVSTISEGSPDQLVRAEHWLSQQEIPLSPPSEIINTTDNSQTECATEQREITLTKGMKKVILKHKLVTTIWWNKCELHNFRVFCNQAKPT